VGPPPPDATRGLGVIGISVVRSRYIRLATAVVNTCALKASYSPKCVEKEFSEVAPAHRLMAPLRPDLQAPPKGGQHHHEDRRRGQILPGRPVHGYVRPKGYPRPEQLSREWDHIQGGRYRRGKGCGGHPLDQNPTTTGFRQKAWSFTANGSIARRAQKAVTLGHTEAATSALDKMCPLMEVRRAAEGPVSPC
jgi:hypothetical protein